MKTARTISATVLFFSVASLDSAGGWWWVVLALAALSLAAMFVLCFPARTLDRSTLVEALTPADERVDKGCQQRPGGSLEGPRPRVA